jgi:hypothetical protein
MMLIKTTFLTAALLLAASASGALAQTHIGPGAWTQLAQPRGKPNYVVAHPKGAPSRPIGRPAYSNDLPFAPF